MIVLILLKFQKSNTQLHKRVTKVKKKKEEEEKKNTTKEQTKTKKIMTDLN